MSGVVFEELGVEAKKFPKVGNLVFGCFFGWIGYSRFH